MPLVGFSTGALFKADFARGVSTCLTLALRAVELSALRFHELKLLEEFVEKADFSLFDYVSIHAPTDYTASQERSVVNALHRIAGPRKWSIVVHPDCIVEANLWLELGSLLCIENMDKRKSTGRTTEELDLLWSMFPDATLCFDIAHAHQVDPSMTEAYRILRRHRDRISQLHVSEVTSSSKHHRLSAAALASFQEVASLIPRHVPVILESPVTEVEALAEIRMAEQVFEPAPSSVHAAHA